MSSIPPNASIITALFDYTGATDEELDFHKGDEFILLNNDSKDWWYVRSSADRNVEGYVPSTYVTDAKGHRGDAATIISLDSKPLLQGESIPSPRLNQGRIYEELDNFKKFKVSGLAKHYYRGWGHLSTAIRPEINVNGTRFKDLYYDNKTGKTRQRNVQCTLGFSLLEAKNIDVDLEGKQIEGRHVRMALFDGTRPLSNIHSISALCLADNESSWRFSTKASLLFPKDDENTCFLRTIHVDLNLCLLFELCVTVTVEGSADLLEVCVGWGMLPLFTSDGGPIENKSYDIKLYPGSPFETKVQLDHINQKPGFFHSLIYGKQTPRLNIRVWKLGKTVLEEINQLPDTILSFLSAVPVISMYRLVLSENLVRDNRFGTYFDPTLALFPVIIEQNDLLQLLAMLWERKLQALSSRSKRSIEVLKKKFQDCLVTVWPMLKLHEFPQFIEGHDKLRLVRKVHTNIIQEMGIMDLLSANKRSYSIVPFHTDEVSFSFP